MFVGEGPGKSENTLGRPFIGRSGRLLRRALDRSGAGDLTISLTNLVLCRPCDRRSGPNRPPSTPESMNCSSRLAQIIEIQKPPVLCTLGRVPEQDVVFALDQLADRGAVEVVHLPHPAWVEREGGVDSPVYARYVEEMIEVVNLAYRKKEP